MFQTVTRRMLFRGDNGRGSDRVASKPKVLRPSIGLALGGGAARGWAHIGVLRTLEAAGYRPDVIAGTSIGAVVGGCYAAGGLDLLEEFALSLTRRRVFGLMDFNLGGSGLITGNRLSDLLEQRLGDTQVDDLDQRFCAIATELRTGHEIWLKHGRLVDALRASYALPGVFRPVRVGGRWLIDGAIVNPIPVSVARAMGARLVIAVNLHSNVFGRGSVIPYWEEAEADADDDTPPESAPGNARRLLQRQMFGRGEGAPGISAVMMDAFNITQDRISRARLAGDPPDVSVSPRMRHVGLFEFHRAREAIAHGIEAAERALDDIAEAVDTLTVVENG